MSCYLLKLPRVWTFYPLLLVIIVVAFHPIPQAGTLLWLGAFTTLPLFCVILCMQKLSGQILIADRRPRAPSKRLITELTAPVYIHNPITVQPRATTLTSPRYLVAYTQPQAARCPSTLYW
jgi:hypothetical protein